MLALLLAGCAAQPEVRREAAHGEFADETLRVGFTTRVYRLVVPASVDLAQPAALVVAFHGMLIDNKDVMPKYTHLNDTAQRHGFILVYPNALGGTYSR